jgi:hypothetical protein
VENRRLLASCKPLREIKYLILAVNINSLMGVPEGDGNKFTLSPRSEHTVRDL